MRHRHIHASRNEWVHIHRRSSGPNLLNWLASIIVALITIGPLVAIFLLFPWLVIIIGVVLLISLIHFITK
jgi:hypothetical protein